MFKYALNLMISLVFAPISSDDFPYFYDKTNFVNIRPVNINVTR